MHPRMPVGSGLASEVKKSRTLRRVSGSLDKPRRLNVIAASFVAIQHVQSLDLASGERLIEHYALDRNAILNGRIYVAKIIDAQYRDTRCA